MGTSFTEKMGYTWQSKLGSAVVWPPIGGYYTHPRTTCSTMKAIRVLETHFEHKWSQAGTRKDNKDQNHRWIVGFTTAGPPELSDVKSSCHRISKRLGG